MSKSNNNSSGGIGFIGLLTLLFIGLKLTGYINWSWWWVLSPMLGVVAFFLVAVVVLLLAEVRK